MFIIRFKALEFDGLFCIVPVNNCEISFVCNGGARERIQAAEGLCSATEGTAMSHPVLPELAGTKSSTNEYTWNYSCLQTHQQQRTVLLETPKGGEALGPGKI